jgi:hypothetical protein
MYIGRHVKYSLFMSDFIKTWIFSTDFREILKCHVMKILLMGAEFSMRTNGERTDMTKLIVAFRIFANASKMVYSVTQYTQSTAESLVF